jgi:hypothetical protein
MSLPVNTVSLCSMMYRKPCGPKFPYLVLVEKQKNSTSKNSSLLLEITDLVACDL